MAQERNISAQTLWKRYRHTGMAGQLQILNDAIDLMQQYNGRSKEYCIFRAMGYDSNDPSEPDSWFKL